MIKHAVVLCRHCQQVADTLSYTEQYKEMGIFPFAKLAAPSCMCKYLIKVVFTLQHFL